MQVTIPSLVGYKSDELAAAQCWFRISPESLTDILPYLTNRRVDDGVIYLDFPNEGVRKFLAEQAAQEGGPQSPAYEMLSSIMYLYVEVINLRQHPILADVCYEMRDGEPDGLLHIMTGNRHLNKRD